MPKPKTRHDHNPENKDKKKSCGKSTCCEKCKAKRKESQSVESLMASEAVTDEPKQGRQQHVENVIGTGKIRCWHGLFKGTLDF
jgi:hypothetical protein